MSIHPQTILIIDDEKAILKLLSKILTRKGYLVDTAEDGEEGLKKIRSNSYPVILTDLKMPGISGEDILVEVKRIYHNATAVIGMSGTPWLLENDLFDAVLEKPCSRQEVFEAIKKVTSSDKLHP